MVISDLVTSKEIDLDSVNTDNWCSCIDGALTKENYLIALKNLDSKILRYSMRNCIWMKANSSDGKDRLPV